MDISDKNLYVYDYGTKLFYKIIGVDFDDDKHLIYEAHAVAKNCSFNTEGMPQGRIDFCKMKKDNIEFVEYDENDYNHILFITQRYLTETYIDAVFMCGYNDLSYSGSCYDSDIIEKLGLDELGNE